MKTKFQKGFTLVELLVVIALVAILAAIAIMVINPAMLQKKSKQSVLGAQLDKLGMAASAMAAIDDNQYFPKCLDFISATVGTVKNATASTNCVAAPTTANQLFTMDVGTLGTITFSYNKSDTTGLACLSTPDVVDTAKFIKWCSSSGKIDIAATTACAVGAGC